MKKPAIHFTAPMLIDPPNPITVNLIGAGGTGSQVLHLLARVNCSLIALNHPGLFVRLFDRDTVSPANEGRQLFCKAEIGMHKSTALISRVNRFYGTNWKAIDEYYDQQSFRAIEEHATANITLSCVDTIAARYEIAEILSALAARRSQRRDHPLYWMDFGNSQDSGQVILSTLTPIKQPESKKYRTVDSLPRITDEFAELLQDQQGSENKTPSCSLAQALQQQDLFINPTIANTGMTLLWKLIRQGMTQQRGVFINLQNFKSVPLMVE